MVFTLKIIIILAMLPYVSIIEFPMDTAPYFIIILPFAFLVLILNSESSSIKISISNMLIILMLTFFCALLLIRFLIFFDLDSFRVFGNYSSMFFAFLFFAILSKSKNAQEQLLSSASKILIIISLLYLTASIFQLITRVSGIGIFSNIIESIIGRGGRTSELRGFNSLTAEPSYAGIVCSLLGSLSIFLYRIGYQNRKRTAIITLSFLITILLSASATVVPFLILFLYYTKKAFNIPLFKPRYLIYTALAGILVLTNVNIDSLRVFQLFSIYTSNSATIFDDVSAVSRLASIVNYSLPLLNGDSFFGSALSEVSPTYLNNIINNSWVSDNFKETLKIGIEAEGGGVRTKSTFSQSLYLFGVLGLLFWILLFHELARSLRRLNESVIPLVIIFLGYMIQIPFGHPSFIIAIGLILSAKNVQPNTQHSSLNKLNVNQNYAIYVCK